MTEKHLEINFMRISKDFFVYEQDIDLLLYKYRLHILHLFKMITRERILRILHKKKIKKSNPLPVFFRPLLYIDSTF